ncbi:hypothetical protein ACQCVP_08315 [Rossellomorea vietnamensis]|uniref:hypothetical protein n=1 Tax=Rossellomorea vietnamensis TaxID=218284 RepID=UPI003CEF9B08
MKNKKIYIKGSRTPSMEGRGTTTVKREVLGQKRSGSTHKSKNSNTSSTARSSKK